VTAAENRTRPPAPRVCDYEASPYREAFWESADRAYEDAAERLAMKALLPRAGRRLAEIGAGFGRLADLYTGHEQVILVDYAASMLEEARRLHGDRLTYVCADLYSLPFATGSLDTIAQVRVLHHVEDVPRAFEQVARSLACGGSYVLEFANKKNAKAVLRWLSGRQAESPFSRKPWEFVPLNWNLHPDYVDECLDGAGLYVRERRAVSHFRDPGIKRRMDPTNLARLDSLLGPHVAWAALAPSQFLRALQPLGRRLQEGLWRCPACGHEPLPDTASDIVCPACRRSWPLIGGVRHFR